jgi:hypothetical protein
MEKELFYNICFHCYIQKVLFKNFLIARHGHIFPYLWMCVYFAALTRSTRLEYSIHMVLMNLQDNGQMSIKVAQCKYRATAVLVCNLNPAG